jgi:hypothetical protein
MTIGTDHGKTAAISPVIRRDLEETKLVCHSWTPCEKVNELTAQKAVA